MRRTLMLRRSALLEVRSPMCSTASTHRGARRAEFCETTWAKMGSRGRSLAARHTFDDKLVVVMRMRASLSAKSKGMAMVWENTLILHNVNQFMQ
jgi:hypothetical protein